MKKTIQLSFIASLLLALSSFTSSPNADFVGTYGICDSNPSVIELTLNEDNTFSYKDFSNPTKPIDVTGNWDVKNNRILLQNDNSALSFHSKWKIVSEGMVAKSRKGMTYYTLVKK